MEEEFLKQNIAQPTQFNNLYVALESFFKTSKYVVGWLFYIGIKSASRGWK